MIELYTQKEQDKMMDKLMTEIKEQDLYEVYFPQPTEDDLKEMADQQGVC